MMTKPNQSITRLAESVPDSRAIFRLLSSKSFVFTKLLEGYIHAVTKIVRDRFKTLPTNRLLIAQDTSDIDLSNLKSAKDELGYLPCGRFTVKKFGLSIHSGLAMTVDGEPLGLLHQESIVREISNLGKTKDRKSKPIEEKESFKWFKCIHNVLKLNLKNELVFIGDRENDINEIFKLQKEYSESEDKKQHFQLLIRARYTRKVNLLDTTTNQLKSLLIEDYIRTKSEIKLKGKINITRTKTESEKEVEVDIYTCKVSLNKLTSSKSRTNDFTDISLNTVMVENISENIRWILFTTLDTSNTKEVLNVVQYYRHRWVIERFHYTLKSGCGIQEIQLKNIESIQKAVILHSITACQILRLTILSRVEPESSCTKLFSQDEWEVIYLAANKTNILPKKPPTLKEITFLLAKLGGFKQWHKTDIPGVKSIWWGIQVLDQLLKIYPRLVVRG